MSWTRIEVINNKIIRTKQVQGRPMFMVDNSLFYSLEVARNFAIKGNPNAHPDRKS